jgi:hypothetical protein
MTAVEHGDPAVYRRTKNRERATKHPPTALLADVDGTLVTKDKVLTAAAKAAARGCFTPALRSPSPAAGRHVA